MNSEHTATQSHPAPDRAHIRAIPVGAAADSTVPASADDLAFRRRFAQGDTTTIKTIHDLYVNRMYAVAHHVLGDHHLAGDAVQQALLQAWRAATSFDPHRPLGPWLFTITRRAAIDVHRRHTDRNRLHPHEAQDLDRAIHPDDERPWLTWQIRTALAALPLSDRQLIQLAYYHHFTHNEIAAQLAIPVGTVKSRLHRAQHKLKSTLHHLNAEHG